MTNAKRVVPPEELERQIMSSVVPKNDREHWACREIERLRHCIENCRLLAARNRKESWALLILGFCAEAGIVGSVTRDYPNADCHGPDWTDRRDAERYRWLRSNSRNDQLYTAANGMACLIRSDKLDAAIDAAMTQGEKK